MADQRRNAGNIGDVVKHAILPHFVLSHGASQESDWAYCETHAGFYDYSLDLLKDGASWKGERAWSVGILESSGQLDALGAYGKELQKGLKAGVYPGSIRVVASLSDPARPSRILGWDIGEEQVASFAGCSDSIVVKNADGYGSIESLSEKNRLVFCDPFWTAKEETSKVIALVERESAVIVWYPLSQNTESFRKWSELQSHSIVEVRFHNYVGGKNGWAGQDMQGSGMMVKGLPESAIDGAIEVGRRLQAIFDGKTHTGKPRKSKGGDLVLPQNRDLGLRLDISI